MAVQAHNLHRGNWKERKRKAAAMNVAEARRHLLDAARRYYELDDLETHLLTMTALDAVTDLRKVA